MAQTVTLTTPQTQNSYQITIGNTGLSTLGEQLKARFPKTEKILLVSETALIPLFAKTTLKTLQQAGFEVYTCYLSGGEASKSADSLNALYNVLLQNAFTRHDVALALGGGIIGDITGYAAATYRRGINFVQVPTTLLAQVDASVGGKVAINYDRYKNMIGTFYQPHWVCIDTSTLKTLPAQIFSCGMAEVIKYAFIQNSIPNTATLPSLLKQLLENPAYTADTIADIITLCCQLKANVVEADPQETKGIREILNFGHTFAHAFETLSNNQIPHGQAVAIGMVYACKLAMQENNMPETNLAVLLELLQKYNLPCALPQKYEANSIIEAMKQDKKRQGKNTHRFILPENALGKVVVTDAIIDSRLHALFG